jgi:hypothetical protein
MEYRASERAYLITAELAGINRLALYPIMRRYLLALLAVHAVRIPPFEYTLKASIIGRILLVKIFECVFRCFHVNLQSQPSNRSITQNIRDVKGYLPSRKRGITRCGFVRRIIDQSGKNTLTPIWNYIYKFILII